MSTDASVQMPTKIKRKNDTLLRWMNILGEHEKHKRERKARKTYENGAFL